MTEYITVAVPVITALGGFKLVEYIVNYNTNKRKAKLEATKVENNVLDDYVEGWKSLSEKQGADLDRKDKRIDSLYLVVDKYRDREAELLAENTALKLENKELRFSRCDINGCDNRTPPRNFAKTE